MWSITEFRCSVQWGRWSFYRSTPCKMGLGILFFDVTVDDCQETSATSRLPRVRLDLSFPAHSGLPGG